MDSNQNMQQRNADTVTDTSENMQASQSQMTQGVPMGQPMYGQAPQGQMPQGAPMDNRCTVIQAMLIMAIIHTSSQRHPVIFPAISRR